LAAEGISVLISRSLKMGALYGVESAGTTYIHHLQFADDTLIFLPNDLQCLLNTKRMLRWFSYAQGLMLTSIRVVWWVWGWMRYMLKGFLVFSGVDVILSQSNTWGFL
jgi:hypothetical protein